MGSNPIEITVFVFHCRSEPFGLGRFLILRQQKKLPPKKKQFLQLYAEQSTISR
jgi:hypothetical protein